MCFIKLETILMQRNILLLLTTIPIATKVPIVYRYCSKEYNNISLRHIHTYIYIHIHFKYLMYLIFFTSTSLFYAHIYRKTSHHLMKNYRLILVIQTSHSFIFLSAPYSMLFKERSLLDRIFSANSIISIKAKSLTLIMS